MFILDGPPLVHEQETLAPWPDSNQHCSCPKRFCYRVGIGMTGYDAVDGSSTGT